MRSGKELALRAHRTANTHRCCIFVVVGQGTWKVYVEKGNGFSDNDEIIPDAYVVAEILGCTSTNKTEWSGG